MTRFLLGLVALMACTLGTTANAATLTVTSNGDNLLASNGICTLREAIANATADANTYPECGAGSGSDVIEFNGSYVITLTSTLQINSGGDLTLNGTGSQSITLTRAFGAGDPEFPLMDVGTIPYFEANRFSFSRGVGSSAAGGLTVAAQHVVLNAPTFFVNSGVSGGAIQRTWNGGIGGTDAGSFTVTDCIISNNSSASSGGAVAVFFTAEDVVSFDGCQINNNNADDNGGVFYLIASGAIIGNPAFSLSNSKLQNNAALGEAGGGLSAFISGPLALLSINIEDSAFIDNRAADHGGAVALFGNAGADEFGLTVRRSSFVENIAGQDEAVGSHHYGGGIAAFNADLGIENSLFLRNTGKNAGGAVYARDDASTVQRSVGLIGNSFIDNWIEGSFGPHTLELFPPMSAAGWEWPVVGNLFSRAGDGSDGLNECIVRNAGGDIDLASGFNYSDEASCQFDVSGGVGPVDPLVVANSSTLDYTRPYFVYAADTSAANDFWPSVYCLDLANAALTVDLLGNLRPKDFDGAGGAACDAGAFERGEQGTLTVTPNPNGHIYAAPVGMPIGPGNGIDCGMDCNQLYPGGTLVRLVYQADPGTYFAGWSGDCSGVADCILFIDGNKSVGAFSPAAGTVHQLDVLLAGDGGGRVDSTNRSGIACEPFCSEEFSQNASLKLAATPDEHSQFNGWTVGSCSSVVNGICNLSMSSSKTAEANFSATEFIVDVTVDGDGSGSVSSNVAGIDCPDTSCSAYFDRNQTIQLLAVTDFGGGTFAGWSGDCSGLGNPCELDMNGGPYSVTATFLLQNTLTVSINGGGFVTSNPAGINCPGDCSQNYNSDVTVELTPNPAPDQLFIGWSGDCSGTGTCQVNMDMSRNVTANFGGVSVFGDGFE